MANTPADLSDTQLNRMVEQHGTVYLSSLPTNNILNNNDDAVSIKKKCPHCASREIGAITPEVIECQECGHRDGDRYERIDCGPFEPAEIRRVRTQEVEA